MRKLLLLLLVVCVSGIASAIGHGPGYGPRECAWPNCDTGNPYVSGGFLTDAGAEAMYALDTLLDPPELTKRYVSADAGGFLPLGDDANAGTIDAPWRSFDKVVTETGAGGYHVYFDDGDTWESGDDFGPVGCTLNDDCNQYQTLGSFTNGCDSTERGCLIWSDFDGLRSTKPTIDCGSNSVDLGFDSVAPGSTFISLVNNANSGDGWFEWVNFQTAGCPINDDDEGDIIAVNTGSTGIGQLLMLNFSVPGLQGNMNQVATSHNDGLSRIVAINSECTITEDEANSVQCFYGLNGGYYIMGRSTLKSTAASPGTIFILQGGAGSYMLFVMGHTVECATGGVGESRGINMSLPSAALREDDTGNRRWLAVVDTLVHTCNEVDTTDTAIQTTMNSTVGTSNIMEVVDLFKVTIANSYYSVQLDNTHANHSRYLDAACVNMDGNVGGMRVDTDPLNNSDVLFVNSLYEDADVANSFNFGNVNFVSAANVAAGNPSYLFPSQALFDITDLNGTDPYSETGYMCADPTCLETCTTLWRYTFPMGDYVPQDLMGSKFRGVIKNETKDQNIGAR